MPIQKQISWNQKGGSEFLVAFLVFLIRYTGMIVWNGLYLRNSMIACMHLCIPITLGKQVRSFLLSFSDHNENKMNTTQIAWALIRKWADFYGTSENSMKKLHFKRAMKKAQDYKDAEPEILKRYLGKWGEEL
jgi:hypothetical protein